MKLTCKSVKIPTHRTSFLEINPGSRQSKVHLAWCILKTVQPIRVLTVHVYKHRKTNIMMKLFHARLIALLQLINKEWIYFHNSDSDCDNAGIISVERLMSLTQCPIGGIFFLGRCSTRSKLTQLHPFGIRLPWCGVESSRRFELAS